jgi:hypothetical protein
VPPSRIARLSRAIHSPTRALPGSAGRWWHPRSRRTSGPHPDSPRSPGRAYGGSCGPPTNLRRGGTAEVTKQAELTYRSSHAHERTSVARERRFERKETGSSSHALRRDLFVPKESHHLSGVNKREKLLFHRSTMRIPRPWKLGKNHRAIAGKVQGRGALCGFPPVHSRAVHIPLTEPDVRSLRCRMTAWGNCSCPG